MPSPAMLIAALLVAAVQSPSRPFVSEAGGFKVNFPADPKLTSREVVFAGAKIELQMLSAEVDKVSTVVIFADYPPEILEKTSPDRFLEGRITGAIAASRGVLVSKADVKLNGHPGKVFEATMQVAGGEERVVRAKLVLVGARLYQLLSTGPREALPKSDSEAFFNSFELTKVGPAAEPQKAGSRPSDAGKKPGPAVATAGKPSPSAGKSVLFESKDGRFSIKLPRSPREGSEAGASPREPTIKYYTVEGDGVSYMVLYSDEPVKPAEADTFLEGIVRGAVNGAQGKLLFKQDLSLSGCPGKEFSFEKIHPNGRRTQWSGKVFLDDRRVYQVFYTSAEGRQGALTRNDFLQSFHILKPSTP